MKHFRVILFIVFTVLTNTVFAQDIPEPMSPPRLVNDFAGVFSANEKSDLEQMLRNYNDSTSTQIYVVTVQSLDGYAISDYAFRLGEKWGIGQKGKDNGAVILIKPKIGNSRGDVFIAVGYGLEEKLNDARIGLILDNDMIPYFRNNNYYAGVRASIETMIDYLSGQFQADPREEEPDPVAIILGIIVFFLIIYIKSKTGGNNRRGGGGGFTGGFFPGGGFSSGGRSSGGGGFGGGGGGRFGGGGAGRSW